MAPPPGSRHPLPQPLRPCSGSLLPLGSSGPPASLQLTDQRLQLALTSSWPPITLCAPLNQISLFQPLPPGPSQQHTRACVCAHMYTHTHTQHNHLAHAPSSPHRKLAALPLRSPGPRASMGITSRLLGFSLSKRHKQGAGWLQAAVGDTPRAGLVSETLRSLHH